MNEELNSISNKTINNDNPIESNDNPIEINEINAATSTGRVSDDGQAAPYFSGDDVRKMSREQVRRNLDKILLSMSQSSFDD